MRLFQGARNKVFVVTAAAIGISGVVASGLPDLLLAYWLVVAVGLGLWVSLRPPLGPTKNRLTLLVSVFAWFVASSLVSTQIAARRTISSTHLQYRGVHFVGLDSITVGTPGSGADVRLQAASSAPMPWSLRLRRMEDGWAVEPLFGIERLRIRHGSTQRIDKVYSVARSVLLRTGESVPLLGPDDEVLDTLRVVSGGVETTSGASLSFAPANRALETR